MAPTFNANRSTKTRRRTTRLRPVFEGLEDRRLLANFLVTSAADSGPGTLRDLIAQANADGVPDEIRFRDGLPQIVLTSGSLSIASRLSIVGPVGGITIARSQDPGTPAFRVLQASAEPNGSSSSQTFVRLENLTISGGMATDPLGGGGILNSGQKLTLVGSTVTGNSSAFFGGAIRSVGSTGSLTVQGCTIRANSAVLDGGGIFSNSPLTVTATSFAGNTGRGGGGIALSAPASIVNSSFSGNSATLHGGALFSLSNPTGQLSITASTLSGNSAPAGTGGGISSVVGPWTLTNTIVAGNSGGEIEGTMLGDHNLIGDASGGLDPSTNLLNVADPRLGPLQDNGGPTATMALLPGSPAIDAGASVPGVGLDQRFAARPAGGAFDIGALESGSDSPGLVVNTADDVVDPADGLTSLREAIAFANARLGPDAIAFDPIVFATPRTLTLNSDIGQLSIEDDLTIAGPAAGVTIARSTEPDTLRFRIFDIRNTLPTLGRRSTVRLEHLTITGGASPRVQDGGGIRAEGLLTLVDCTIRGNSNGAGIRGGGIFASLPLTVVDSTIDDNSSGFFGGGIFADVSLTLVNSTVTRNTAGVQGGGAFAVSGIISNSTIVGNTASDGGGILGTSNLTVNNSIVAGNAGGDLSGVVNGRANLIGDSSGGLDPSTNRLNAGDPRLGPLQDNGGPTQTMALLPGSPAVDAGVNGLAVDADGNPLPNDQRGADHPRVINGTVDIGAFEFQSAASTTILTLFAPSSTYGQRATFIATVSADGNAQVEGTVTFLDGGVVLASGVPLNAGGQATYSTSDLDVAGSPHAITAQYSGAPGAPPSTSSALSIVITPAPLTATVVVPSKRYDGTTAAAIVSTTLVGLFGNDQVGVTGGTATFDSRNAGTGRLVTVTGLVLDGPDAGNYALRGPVIRIAEITPLPITGTVTAGDKVYDATTAATISSRSLIGVLGSDDVRLTGGVATFSDKNVGTGKTVTATGLTLTGADAGNYTANTTATTTAAITRLAITGSITASDKTYDGTVAATITGRTLSGVLAGDAVTYVGGKAAFADRNAGAGKTVTATVLQLAGPDAGNYSVNTTARTTASIRPATMTVRAFAQNKVYDGTTAATVTLSDNRVAGDLVTLTHSAAAFADANAGVLKPVNVTGIRLGGPDAGNYIFNAAATTFATIFKASQKIVWSDPDDIGFATPLGPAQLSAVVFGVPGGTRPGALTFAPRAGTVLPIGMHQALTVTASATVNYDAATLTVHINVLSTPQQVRELVFKVIELVGQGTLPQPFLPTAIILLNIIGLSPAAAVGRLIVFGQLVRAFEVNDLLTEAQAQSLLTRADMLRRTLTSG